MGDVQKPLAAVWRIADKGNLVQFGPNPENNFIQNVERLRAEKAVEFLKKAVDQRKPTEQEVKDHNHTHVPYRNWFPRCVKAKEKDLGHWNAVNGERDNE